MLSKKTAFAILVLLLFIFAYSLLTTHQIPENFQGRACAENFRLFREYRVVLNCDSYNFMRIAWEPETLFEPGNRRQARPGLIYLASVVMKIITPLIKEFPKHITLAPGRLPKWWRTETIFAYAVYVSANFFIVLLTLWAFLRMAFKEHKASLAAVLIGAVLILNDVGKIFLLTPHTAIVIIFVPLYCLWAFQGVLNKGWFTSPKIIFLSILTGFLITWYGGFVIFIPSVVIAQLKRISLKASKRDWALLIGNSLLITLIVAAPYYAWIQWVIAKTGFYYNVEIERGNQVVWMWAAFEEGTLISSLASNAFGLVMKALPYLVFIIAYLLVISWVITGRKTRLLFSKERLTPLLDGLIVSALFIAFFSAVGLIEDRLAFSMIPALVVPLANFIHSAFLNAPQNKRTAANYTAGFFVTALFAFEILKLGPFS